MAAQNRWGLHRRKDIAGQTFGCLTAIADAGTTGQKRLWRFRCVCGREVIRVPRKHLASCGCKTHELRSKPRSHGMSYHPAYWVWRSMIDRCRLPTHQAWKNYGGRGIRVCKHWQKFENFWTDMKTTYQKGLTLERKKNDGMYCKSNCVWTTYATQANNRRNNTGLTLAAREANIGKTTLEWRMQHWPEARWFEPVGGQDK